MLKISPQIFSHVQVRARARFSLRFLKILTNVSDYGPPVQSQSLFSYSLLAGCVMFAFRIAWYLLEFILPSSKVSCASGCQTASKYNTSTSMFNSGQGVFSSNATLFFFQTFVGDCSQRVFNFLFQQSTAPVSKIRLAYLDANLAYFSDWHLCWGYRW